MGRFPWIIQVGPECSHICPYKEEAGGVSVHTEEKVMQRQSRE